VSLIQSPPPSPSLLVDLLKYLLRYLLQRANILKTTMQKFSPTYVWARDTDLEFDVRFWDS
jgi:hypothetical protein